MPKLSVIIPCYNARDTIAKTLHSIAMQTIADSVEVLVINDCDGLNYRYIIDTASFGDLNIRYIVREKNGGAGAARNTGIREAATDYLFFIDSDDMLVSPLALEVMYNRIVAEKADLLTSVFESEMRFADGVAIRKMEHQLTWTHGKMYRRQFLLDNNILFKEELRLNEDVEFNQMVLDLGAKTSDIPMATTLWRDNPHSITHQSLYNNKKSYVEAVTVYLQECAGRKMDSQKVVLRTLQNLVVCYQYYTLVVDDSPENENDYLQACRTYWKLAEPMVNNVDDDYFTKVYCSIMKDFKAVPIVSFTQFLNELRAG